MSKEHDIVINGARTHNLKNVSVNIPKNKLIIITGVSGSGKSSLAFDTIFAEGQRRFLAALSFNAQQNIDQLPKPEVDSIKGLLPAISLKQNNTNRNPRSTIGTVTDIYDYLKLIYSRIGTVNGKKHEFQDKDFSFNSPYGACPSCKGKGSIVQVEPNLLIDYELTLNEGAILPWTEESSQVYEKLLVKVCKELDFDMNVPVEKLPKEFIKKLLYGISDMKFKVSYKNYKGKYRTRTLPFEGIIAELEKSYKETPSNSKKEKLEKYMDEKTCPNCNGYRLKKESLEVTINRLNIGEVTNLSIIEVVEFFDSTLEKLASIEKQVVGLVFNEIKNRLYFMNQIGLSYLTLDRSITTLSGGEMQRLRLATQISSDLSGVLYVLDEPSIGLHERDNERLIESIKSLRDLGNTVIVVEHDEEIMKESDFIIDIGPSAGELGGNIIATGNPRNIMENKKSITGNYLSNVNKIFVPDKRRKAEGNLVLSGCSERNLKNIDVKIPLKVFTTVTGVSGSGKSTLVNEILYKALSQDKNCKLKIKKIIRENKVDKVIRVSQTPIGRTPRSTPSTYVGVFDDIRDVFVQTTLAKKRSYTKGTFSFNVEGGRCDECKGDGSLKFDMNVISDIYVTCPVCHGKRYKKEVLDVKYKDRSIADILEMTVKEAIELFEKESKITRKLNSLINVGLSYIKLGQSSTTLSGGEAQRVKLSKYLQQQDTGNDLYIFDEPTTGLHMEDIKRLLGILNQLVNKGNTVLVIEHNLDVIKSSDYVIDLGPEGGDKGGYVIAYGTPEDVSKVKESITGKYLKSKLNT